MTTAAPESGTGSIGVAADTQTAAPDRRLGRITIASVAVGLACGVLLAFAPFIPATEAGATAGLLVGFALGWSLLAALSTRLTTQPQRWAWAPAAFMAVGAAALLGFGTAATSWVWPPALLVITVWSFRQVRRPALSLAPRMVLYPLLAVLAVASVGAGIETVLEARDAAAYPMPGQLVDVDGHGMHLRCAGTGSPTVVLEPGAGDMASTMAWIAPAVARDTRVCVYDRPGRGWSDESDAPQDATRVASDLQTLLKAAHVPGPYVLAGHSFGGLYVMAYAAHYPADVAGMVLVDSTAPTTAGPGPVTPAVRDDVLVRTASLVSVVSRVGLGRLYAQLSYGTLPSPAREEVRASVATPATLRSAIDEYIQGNSSMQEAAELRTLGAKPLFVLTAGAGSADDWFAKQDGLARLSTNSVHRQVAGASHEMLVTDEAPAAATAAAIREVVSAVRTGTPLSR